MKKLIILSILLFGCVSKAQQSADIQQVDTTLSSKSDSLAEQAMVVLPKADKHVDMVVKGVDAKMEGLRNEAMKAKTIKTIIRDTVYITEKKNFWGRKKTTVDSSGSVVVIDSLEN